MAAFDIYALYSKDMDQVTIRASVTDATPRTIAALLTDPRTDDDTIHAPATAPAPPRASPPCRRLGPPPFHIQDRALYGAHSSGEHRISAIFLKPTAPGTARAPRDALAGLDGHPQLPDGTTTARSPRSPHGTKVFRSHSPPARAG
jgi:hypothetical protein